MRNVLCLRVLRLFATALFVVYVGWNAWWLAHEQLPMSLMKGLTGLPAPTTGLTRSLLLLWRGEFGASLTFHPLAIPMMALFLGSLAWLAAGWIRHGPLRLPAWLYRPLLITLACAWVIKLLSPRQYW